MLFVLLLLGLQSTPLLHVSKPGSVENYWKANVGETSESSVKMSSLLQISGLELGVIGA